MEVNQLNEGLVLKTRQVQIQFVIQELQYYSQLSPIPTPLGPTLSVRLREMSVLERVK